MVCLASGRSRGDGCPSGGGASPRCTSAEWLSDKTNIEKSMAGSLSASSARAAAFGLFGSLTWASLRHPRQALDAPGGLPPGLPIAGWGVVTFSALAAESCNSFRYRSTSFSSSTPFRRLRSRTRTSRSQGLLWLFIDFLLHEPNQDGLPRA